MASEGAAVGGSWLGLPMGSELPWPRPRACVIVVQGAATTPGAADQCFAGPREEKMEGRQGSNPKERWGGGGWPHEHGLLSISARLMAMEVQQKEDGGLVRG